MFNKILRENVNHDSMKELSTILKETFNSIIGDELINRIIYITDKGLKVRIKTALKEAAIEEFTTASKLIFDEDTNI